MTEQNLIQKLGSADKTNRLSSLEELKKLYDTNPNKRPVTGSNVNNHIHTIYSFSPYSPTEAVFRAYQAGLATAGIMDHDSVAGINEFIEAGSIIGLPVTVGFEQRVSFKDTPFAGMRINNTDQDSVAYLAMHGIPHDKIDIAEEYLKPYREKRNVRNKLMTQKLDSIVSSAGLAIDFEKNVLPLSQYKDGGSVTERHILYSLALKIINTVGPGPDIAYFLKEKFNIEASGSSFDKLNDANNEYYDYHLLGVLKGYFVDRFYIDADEELPDYRDFIGIAQRLGAIPAYAYLGDVGNSVTGDKRAQHFEDSYLDDFIAFIASAGFKAVTYMPTRNTDVQLKRLIALCQKHKLFQICGEDINTPFQSFLCKALEREEYKHLIDAAWALIEHENGKGLLDIRRAT